MNDLRKAAQQALEALIWHDETVRTQADSAAIIELRAALAQPEQEPVAWMNEHGHIDRGLDAILDPTGWTPLYTAPPQRKPLTEAVIVITLRDAGYSIITNQETETAVRVFRIAERAHGIGEEK